MEGSISDKMGKGKLPVRVDKALDWLETSRDSWKIKTKASKDQLKKTKQEVKRARQARDELKERLQKNDKSHQEDLEKLRKQEHEIAELRAKLAEADRKIEELKKKELAPQTQKPRGHTFWNSIIAMTLTLMHVACLSFTGTANALDVFYEQHKLDRAPAIETCIQWEMKFGLYKLNRPKEIANDWVWIADHVVNKGVHKCLAIVGVRMSRLEKKEHLTIDFEDLEPLAIVPMRTSNGALIEIELENVLRVCNGCLPLAILKDQGSDLLCGGRRFSEAHPDVINLNDVPHKIALEYEHLLKDDELWTKFTEECASFKKKVQLTQFANIAPPNQRSKARYHNIDVLVDWSMKKLLYDEDLSKDEKKKLEWLKRYEKGVHYWNQLVEAGRVCRNFVRTKGLYKDCYEDFNECLVEVPLCARAEQFACNLSTIIEEEGNKVPEGKKVIGSSEILESLFGKHKTISERGPKQMGRLILSMASRVGERATESLVKTAFEKIRECDVDDWLKRAFN